MVMTLPPIFIANQVGTGGGGGITCAMKFVLSQDIVFPPSHESHSHSRLICSLLMARNTPFLGVCSYSLHFARRLFCSRAEKPKRSQALLKPCLTFPQKQHNPLCQLIFPVCSCSKPGCAPVSKVHLLTHFPRSAN